MGFSNRFFRALELPEFDSNHIKKLSKETGVSVSRLRYYNDNNILPSGDDLSKVLSSSRCSEVELSLKMGIISGKIAEKISQNASVISDIIDLNTEEISTKGKGYSKEFCTNLGDLYRGDCLEVLSTIENDSVDLVFADPPFNLNKLYPSEMDDNLAAEKYISWTESWIQECVRVLKPGGALFIWNLPKWNTHFAHFLNGRMSFRHWIAVDIKYGMPVSGRLYPSHYSLLYYVNGSKPKAFSPDRMPMATCQTCFSELKDYGGYKSKMNPAGISLTDVWADIPPVRHARYKRRKGANELSLKLLDRVIEMASSEGDLVLDPFGGSGTTYVAAELKKRRWIGCELGPVDEIVDRFTMLDLEAEIINDFRDGINSLFPSFVERNRKKRGLWTADSFLTE